MQHYSMDFPLEGLISYISNLDDNKRSSLCNIYHLIIEARISNNIVGDPQSQWIIFVDKAGLPVTMLPPIPPAIILKPMNDRVFSALNGFQLTDSSFKPSGKEDFAKQFYLGLNKELESRGIKPLSLKKLLP